MNLAKIKWEILDLLGYVFCEASFRWWDMFDDGSDLEDKVYHQTRLDRLTYLAGVPSYRAGCFFYNLQDDEKAGVMCVEVPEVVDENR